MLYVDKLVNLKQELQNARTWMDTELLDIVNIGDGDYTLLRIGAATITESSPDQPNYQTDTEWEILRWELTRKVFPIDYVKICRFVDAENLDVYRHVSPYFHRRLPLYSTDTEIYFLPDYKWSEAAWTTRFPLEPLLTSYGETNTLAIGADMVKGIDPKVGVYRLPQETCNDIHAVFYKDIPESFLAFISFLAKKKSWFIFVDEASHSSHIMINLKSINEMLDNLIVILTTNITLLQG